MSLSKELRGTDSFIWCTIHAVGNGATSTVYVGRYKKTGEQVAIKVFNDTSYSRPRDVRTRELEVVRKLKHKNIVEVLAIEEDHVSKQPVIIMELCRGGSLLQYLDEPENIFGLREKEFLTALKHILDGMKYLRRSGVVHRDIKPGNIMRVKDQDGSHTYKLADFGAAREVEDEEETLQSLYGTEEYLRADLYGIAVLRAGGGAVYTTTVDLWSLGVTLYQLATGQLPFRPYGGRRNRETMHYLITRKAPGVISGVQHDSPTGRIEWSKDLPTNCHLSRGLKPLVTYILARLLESDRDKILSFEELFEYTDRLTTMKHLDVYNTLTTEMLNIYVSLHAESVEVSLKIAEQSNIKPMNQLLCWKNTVFDMEETVKCKDLPQTQKDSPFFLYSKENYEPFGTPVISTPELPTITSAYNLENDAPIAKMGCATLIFFLVAVTQIQQAQRHVSSAANTFLNVYRDGIRSGQYMNNSLQQLQMEIKIKIDMLLTMIRFCLISTIPDNIDPRIKEIKNTLANTVEEINILTKEYKQNLKRATTKYNKLESLGKQTFPHNFDDMRCKDEEKCIERLAVLIDDVREIYDQFKKDKREKRLKYNEEQIHKMDKQKLRCKCVQGASLLRDHCEPNLKTLHRDFGSWYRNINNNMQLIKDLQTDMEEIREKFYNFIKCLDEIQDKLIKVLTSSNDAVNSVFNKCVAREAELQMSRDEVQALNKTISNLQVAKKAVEHKEPLGSECINPRQIRVPKRIKEQFLSMGNDIEKTTKEISESARILEEIRIQDEQMKTVIY